MARKSSKPRKKAAEETPEIEDAGIAEASDDRSDATPPADETPDDGTPAPEAAPDEAVSSDAAPAAEDLPDPNPAETTADAEDTALNTDQDQGSIEDAPYSDPTPAAAPAPVRQPVFLPMLLGGLLAGAIGYGVAYLQYANSADGPPPVTQDDLAALKAEIAAEQVPFDSSRIDSDIGALRDELSGRAATLEGSLADLAARVDTVEKQPSGDGTLQEAAIAAYERDLQGLRDEIAAQQAALQAVADQAAEQLEVTRNEALQIEQSAIESARTQTARASLARIQGALDSGAPFGAALSDLEQALGQTAPAAVSDVADGAPTLGSLQSDFPAAARAALATARQEGTAGEATSGLGAFLRSQLDIRSTAPQEGDSVDAILSRAEAALREGRLNDALAEVAALPEVSRGAMSDWLGAAESRAAAIDAADSLASTLTDN